MCIVHEKAEPWTKIAFTVVDIFEPIKLKHCNTGKDIAYI